MKKVIYLILLVCSFVSCNNNTTPKPERPNNLISESKMVDILYDMSLLNAAKGSNKRVIEENGLMPKDYIYQKFDIDSVQFAESNNYYSYNLDVYESIYNKVQVRLKASQKKYQKLIEIEKKRKDSITKQRKKERDSISKISKKKKDSLKNTLQILDTKKKHLEKAKISASDISEKLKKQLP